MGMILTRGTNSLKRRPIHRKNVLGQNRPRKRHRIKPKKIPKGTPAWIKAIPRGLHGSGHLQKRLWRLTSDYCRIRDSYRWDGRCIATGMTIYHWNNGQAGHYRGYTTCNGMFKFDPMNIHLQTAQSNSWPTSRTWEVFAANLRSRYGEDYIEKIDKANEYHAANIRITTERVMQDIERKIEMIRRLPEKPPYWTRLATLRSKEIPPNDNGAQL